jgi:hypothetical protein
MISSFLEEGYADFFPRSACLSAWWGVYLSVEEKTVCEKEKEEEKNHQIFALPHRKPWIDPPCHLVEIPLLEGLRRKIPVFALFAQNAAKYKEHP